MSSKSVVQDFFKRLFDIIAENSDNVYIESGNGDKEIIVEKTKVELSEYLAKAFDAGNWEQLLVNTAVYALGGPVGFLKSAGEEYIFNNIEKILTKGKGVPVTSEEAGQIAYMLGQYFKGNTLIGDYFTGKFINEKYAVFSDRKVVEFAQGKISEIEATTTKTLTETNGNDNQEELEELKEQKLYLNQLLTELENLPQKPEVQILVQKIVDDFSDVYVTGGQFYEKCIQDAIDILRDMFSSGYAPVGPERAHELLQLVTWTEKYSVEAISNPEGSLKTVCDPENDPIPEEDDPLDEVMDKYVVAHHDDMAVIYRDTSCSKYYMVFNDLNANLAESREYLLQKLNAAYKSYRKFMDANTEISPSNIMLLGYNYGGSLAAALSAALSAGAFSADRGGNVGEFTEYLLLSETWTDAEQAKYRYMPVQVEALTFNAPSMGWAFNGVFAGTLNYCTDLQKATVTNYVMKNALDAEDQQYITDVRQVIGQTVYLKANDGKIPVYKEYNGGKNPDWTALDTLELALHGKEDSPVFDMPSEHEALQLVRWAESGAKTLEEWGAVCDPENDPDDASLTNNTIEADIEKKIKEYRRIEEIVEDNISCVIFSKDVKVKNSSQEGNEEGVYRTQYYLVFKDFDTDISTRNNDELEKYLNTAYKLYRKFSEKYRDAEETGVHDSQIGFFGYGSGGTLASFLSAALFSESFAADLPSGAVGGLSRGAVYYYPKQCINGATFNAYNINLLYGDWNISEEVPVNNYRLANDPAFKEGTKRAEYIAGNVILLYHDRGKIPLYIEGNDGGMPSPEWWHTLDALEMALHDGEPLNSFWMGSEHEMLQLVRWAASENPDTWNEVCDPYGDPHDLYHIQEDELDKSFATQGKDGDYQRIEKPVDSFLAYEVFSKEIGGRTQYYLVFKDGKYDLNNVASGAQEMYINEAYKVYRTLVDEKHLTSANVALFGHGHGGTVAALLSAALYHGLFKADAINPKTGEVIEYGYLLEFTDTNETARYPKQAIRTMTFNAYGVTQLADVLRRSELLEEPHSKVPVLNVGMNEHPLFTGKWKSTMIGEAHVLTVENGKLPAYIDQFGSYEDASLRTDWAGLDVLELALHGEEDREESFEVPDGHEAFQLVRWSKLGTSSMTCDPAGDPEGNKIDHLDNKIKKYSKVDFSRGELSNSVFSREVNGRKQYYLVFDDFPGNLSGYAAQREILTKAYSTYRRLLEDEEIGNLDVVLIGYGNGGTVASLLSAALYDGAFAKDRIDEEGNRTYGRLLDRMEMELYGGFRQKVNAITFDAPWVIAQKSLAFDISQDAPVVNYIEGRYFDDEDPADELQIPGKVVKVSQKDVNVYEYLKKHSSSDMYGMDVMEYALHGLVPTQKGPFKMADKHEAFQLVRWSSLDTDAQTCDPAGDPEGGNLDNLDKKIKEYNKVEFGSLTKPPYVSLFTKKVGGRTQYYLVFDDFSESLSSDYKKVDYLNRAYHLYRRLLDREGITSADVALLGYGNGGTLASMLSAALYAGAFAKDAEDEAGNRVAYGYLVTGDKEVERYPKESVQGMTFNAPSVSNASYLPFEFVTDVPVTNYRVARVMSDTKGAIAGKTVYLKPVNESVYDYVSRYSPEGQYGMDVMEYVLHRLTPAPEEPDPPQVQRDPLILDLNRDGKVSTTSDKRYFDMDGNGIAEQVSWAGRGDGFLAMDRDGDGQITSGRELFGDNTIMSDGRVAGSGFEALSELDSNKDGRIDAQDEMFDKLRVWHDKDGDGIFAANELSTLSELGIESLNLSNTMSRTEDENGNQIVRTGTFTWQDGEVGKMSEFLLERDTINALVIEELPVPEDIAALPDLHQRGYLYSLHQAMARDESGELKSLVQQFTEAASQSERYSLMNEIILKWSDVSDLETVPYDGWKGFMKKFYGNSNSYGEPTAEGERQLARNYQEIFSYLYGELLEQTHYAEILDRVTEHVDESGNVRLFIGDALEEIAKGYFEDPELTKGKLADFFAALTSAGVSQYVDESEIAANERMLLSYGEDLAAVCRAAWLAGQYPVGSVTIAGQDANGTGLLEGDENHNIIVGTSKEEMLKGGRGDDVLIGGRGDDVLEGGPGSDIYVWNLGDGNDRIINSSEGAGEIDVLRLGEGIHPENIKVERVDNTIRLTIGESGEVLTLETNNDLNRRIGDLDPKLQVERVEFADGTVWSREYLLSLVLEVNGTDGDDVLAGSSGDELLVGGAGDDVLRGGRGSDLYVWNLGDGNDTIEDMVYGVDQNVLRFGEGITPEMLEFRNDGRNLCIDVLETGETITVLNWYSNKGNKLTYLEFADGSEMSAAEIDEITGNYIRGTDGDDVIHASPNSNIIIGGKGDDMLNGGEGNDVYVWNVGDGNDVINNDTGYFNYFLWNRSALRFGEGVRPEDLDIRASESDLKITVKSSGEIITVNNWFVYAGYQLAAFEFFDGTVWDSAKIEEMRDKEIAGTEEAETLTGTQASDILIGHKGDDVLDGGVGDDIYVWRRGDGNDVIQDTKGSNTLQFGEGIRPEDVRVRITGEDLLLEIDNESVRVTDWYKKQTRTISSVTFADGTRWTLEDLNARLDLTVMGTDGDDVLEGSILDDTFIGGMGNDVLNGGAGNDTYIWRRGDGNDTIVDTSGINTLRFEEGIKPEDIRVSGEGYDLFFEVGNERVVIPDWYEYKERTLARIEFCDGTVWDSAKITEMRRQEIIGTDADDILWGSDIDDVLIGRKGDDILRGEAGDDIYIWNRGDGNDVISDTIGINTLKFGEGIAPEDVRVTGITGDLFFEIGNECIRVFNWFSYKDRTLAKVEFADGTVWDNAKISEIRRQEIIGTDENDILYGSGLNDVLIGGKGDDILRGRVGDDVYVWNKGDGNDVIDDRYGSNTLKFGEGIAPEDVRVTGVGYDLFFEIGAERIEVSNWFYYKDEALARVEFADGTIWESAKIAAMREKEILGTDGDDTLRGSTGGDILIGGKGDDVLHGDLGDDVYVWNKGDGNDTIVDASGGNALQFGEGITPEDVRVTSTGSDLYIRVGSERIRVSNWSDKALAKVKFADGTVWKYSEIEAKIEENPEKEIFGTYESETVRGTENDDIITGGRGDDILRGGGGNDVYIWNRGDGNDVIEDINGVNTLRFGEGITPDDIRVTGKEGDFFFEVGDERIRVSDWFSSEKRALSQVEFMDGTVWDSAKIEEMREVEISGTDEDDYIEGTDQADILAGRRGNDYISGGSGDDTYIWRRGDGNDTIYDINGMNTLRFGKGITPEDIRISGAGETLVFEIGEERIRVLDWFSYRDEALARVEFADGTVWDSAKIEGMRQIEINGTDESEYIEGTNRDDILIGQKGDDYLSGYGGDDIYVWNRGDGNDTVWDFSGSNTLRFGEGIAPEDVRVTGDGNNLYFEIGDERITISYWFYSKEEALAKVEFADDTVWDSSKIEEMREKEIIGTDEDDYLTGTFSNDIFIGGKGNDYIYGGYEGDNIYIWSPGDGNDTICDSENGNGTLKFGEGVRPDDVRISVSESDLVLTFRSTGEKIRLRDWYAGRMLARIEFPDGEVWNSEEIDQKVVRGTWADDIITGSAADEFLSGGAGSDTYVWNLGDGNDRIQDENLSGEDINVLRFGEGIDPADVTAVADGWDVVFVIGKTGERITVEKWRENESFRLQRVEFADGTVWNGHEIRVNVYGTDEDDHIEGAPYAADERFAGGKGDDTLQGGPGNDVYVWGPGDGNDRIRDSEGINVLEMGDGVAPEKIRLHRDKADLVLEIEETGERVTVEKWFDIDESKLSQIKFADGTAWNPARVQELLAGNGNVVGTEANDSLFGTSGSDVLIGLSGNDVLSGGKGDDVLYGDRGDDIYIWNVGDGNDVIEDHYGRNVLRLEGVASPESVKFSTDGQNLIISVHENTKTEQITVRDWLYGAEHQLAEIQIGDQFLRRYDVNSMLNIVEGTTGDDVLYGSDESSDVLKGGKGDDILDGGSGNDTYLWAPGDGNDTIIDSSGVEHLCFGEGVTPESVRIERDFRHLYFVIGEERIKFENWFYEDWEYVDHSSSRRSHTVSFTDGTVWDRATVEQFTHQLIGTDGDDTLTGYGYGNTFTGGKGDDILTGKKGGDVYIWNIGDGNDTIISSGQNDELKFEEGVTPESVHVERDKKHLYLVIGDERITVKNWFFKDRKIDKVSFVDGTVWDWATVEEFTHQLIGTDGDDTLTGYGYGNTFKGGKGDDILTGKEGEDVYIWDVGDGNDTIISSGRDNELRFGEGVTPESVRFDRDEWNLYVVVGDERIKLEDWFYIGYGFKITFSDGTVWDQATVEEFSRQFIGTDGNDTLTGYGYGNTFIGGKGDDVLIGKSGNDVYVWNIGDGNDTIISSSLDNELRFGKGVTPESVCIERDEKHLYIVIGDERIKLVNFFYYGSDYHYEYGYINHYGPNFKITFSDGTIWDSTTLEQISSQLIGTDGDDTLTGYGYGNTFKGGKGDDVLIGKRGGDVYVWDVGDGNDTIIGTGWDDELRFGEGVTPSSVHVERDEEHLYIVVGDERIKLKGWVGKGSGYKYGFKITFSDGTVWSGKDIDQRVNELVGTDGNDTLTGYSTNDTLIGGKGDDVLYGGYGNDTYIWNIGDGHDIIVDVGGTNIIALGEGVNSSMVSLSRDEADLHVLIGAEGITIKDWFSGKTDPPYTEIRFSDGVVWSRETILKNLPSTGIEDNSVVLRGTDGDDTLKGNFLDNKVYGGDGNDIIDGDKGDDVLYGEAGDDTYVWRPGDGNDTIIDRQGHNVLELSGGIEPEDITLTRDDRNLYVVYKKTGEQIKVDGWFVGNKLVEIRFSDGTAWSSEDIDAPFRSITGTDGSDALLGYGDSDDVLYGLDGNDILSGLGGDDTLIGGKGDDRLYGGRGDDIYIWDIGDGNDIIQDDSGKNTLRFGEGILAGNVRVSRDANNLYFHVPGDEVICVEKWFRSENNRLSAIEFADGTTWDADTVEEHLQSGKGIATEGDDIISGTDGDDVLDGLGGDDTIYGGGGDDILVGGKGRDELHGEGGNDTYSWSLGDGNDVLVDSEGANRLEFGAEINPTMVKAEPYGMDLILKVGDGGEYITIRDWFADESNKMFEIVFADGTVWTASYIDAGINIIEGTENRDVLYGSSGNDLIFGNDGNDTLYGGNGNDSLVGGKGNDTLEGGQGDDSYIWRPGDGNDTLYDAYGANVLQIGEGIGSSEVETRRSGNNLVLVMLQTGEQVTIRNWYVSASYQFAEVRFADGTVWSRSDINEMPSIYRGTEADDKISASNGADLIYGNEGADQIYGNGGNDTIVGGAGDDSLYGGAGDDLYIWNIGDGNDVIIDNSGLNTLRIGEGITPEDIRLKRDGKNELDLAFVMGETGEQVTVTNWFAAPENQLQVEFSDGTVWSRMDVMGKIEHSLQGTDGDDVLNGSYLNDVIRGYAGDDKLYGHAGNDILAGGTGDDSLEGGAGDDIYVWNPGDGEDSILDESGRNVLKLGEGVSPGAVDVRRSGNDLVLVISENGERVIVKNWYYKSQYQLAEIQFADGTVWTKEQINELTPILEAPRGGGRVNGTGGDDIIWGRDGNDSLYGSGGNDVLRGRGGDDYLEGGAGDDTYIWNVGDGNDILSDAYGSNVLELGEGVTPDKVVVSRDSYNLYLTFTESGERITIKNWYSDEKNRFAEVRFSDGTMWSKEALMEMALTVRAPEAGGKLSGFNTDDTLIGSAFRDEIYGNAGNDIIEGRGGDDYLEGGAGDDTYIWNPGDGNDTIYDNAGSNVLKVGEGIDPSKVELTRDSYNLYLKFTETGEKLTVKNWYSGAAYQLAEIQFADGTAWTKEQVNAISPVLRGTDGNETINGYATNDILIGGKGNDTLQGGAGDDTYIWNSGDGNDVLYDYYGSNAVQFGEGISPDKVVVSRDSYNLYLTFTESGERITIKNWYSDEKSRFAEVRFSDGTVWGKEALMEMALTVRAPEAGGKLSGFNTDDTLVGSAFRDEIYGNAGNDIIEGRGGDDYLEGGAGNDTYIWNPGDGNDTIYDNAGSNVLKVEEGIDPSKVELTRDSYNLYLKFTETGEKLTVKNWYSGAAYQLAEIQFADGTVWTKDQVNAMPLVFRGTEGNETINGYATNDILIGGKGDDTLQGGAGNDTYVWNPGDGNDTIYDNAGSNVLKVGEGIDPSRVELTRDSYNLYLKFTETGERLAVKNWYSGAAYQLSEIQFADGTVWTKEEVNAMSPILRGTDGNETINGYATNDILIGGKGNDTLQGGAGDDTYIWNVGDGNDILSDVYGSNVLEIGEGVMPDEVVVSRDSYNLYLTFTESGERITIKNWYYNADNRFAEVRFADGTSWSTEALMEMALTVRAPEAGGKLSGFNTDDTLVGSAFRDEIYGNAGNDIIEGRGGDDYLEGGAGNDTYIWSPGDGNDTIHDNAGSNVLKVGEGIDPSKVELTRDSYNLYLKFTETGEKLTVKNWYSGAGYQLSEIQFAEGTVWTKEQVNAMSPVLQGTDGRETINGYATNDTLYGGKGDDTLQGGKGDDTYIWHPGDGNDTIYDNAGANVLKVGEGIDPDKVVVSRDSSSLYLTFSETGEKLTVRNWYSGAGYQLAEIQFADGTVWTREQVNAMSLVLQGTEGKDTLNGFATNDTLYGGKGDDTLQGGAGNDTYIWHPGDGNDTIYDNAGSNVLKIGEGVSPDKVVVSRDSSSLYLTFSETGEKLTVRNWHSGAAYQLSEIQFADGTVWTREQVNAMPVVFRGTDGNDTISTYASNEIIYGGDGNDRLNAGDGDDVIYGGKGNDYLQGGRGNDVYVWDLGDGNDTINENYSGSWDLTQTGTLRLGAGVDPDNVEVTRSGSHLIFTIGETGEQIKVQNWYSHVGYKLTHVEFSDGTVWTTEDVEAVESGTYVKPVSAASMQFESADASLMSSPEILSVSSGLSFSDIMEDIEGFDIASAWRSAIDAEPEPAPLAYDIAKLQMDVAVAGLGFEMQDTGQVADLTSSGSSEFEYLKLSTSAEEGFEKQFEKKE